MNSALFKLRTPQEQMADFTIPSLPSIKTDFNKPISVDSISKLTTTFTKGKRWQHIDDIARRTSYRVGPGCYNISKPSYKGAAVTMRPDTAAPIISSKHFEFYYAQNKISKKDKDKEKEKEKSKEKKTFPRSQSQPRMAAHKIPLIMINETIPERPQMTSRERKENSTENKIKLIKLESSDSENNRTIKPVWKFINKPKVLGERNNSVTNTTGSLTMRERNASLASVEPEKKFVGKRVDSDWYLSHDNPYLQNAKIKKVRIKKQQSVSQQYSVRQEKPVVGSENSLKENFYKNQKNTTMQEICKGQSSIEAPSGWCESNNMSSSMVLNVMKIYLGEFNQTESSRVPTLEQQVDSQQQIRSEKEVIEETNSEQSKLMIPPTFGDGTESLSLPSEIKGEL